MLPQGTRIDANGWTLAYDRFEADQEGLREALTSTGNGYFCSRGTAEWQEADGVHYPGTYRHGIYNRETTIMAAEPVLNEDLVNLPNWLLLRLRIGEEEPFRLGGVELLEYRHEYSARDAVIMRRLRFRDRRGRVTVLGSRRFVSMAGAHQTGLEWTITPENWSGRVRVISALDSRVTNRGVARYSELEGRHLNPVSTRGPEPDVISLIAQTRQSRLFIAEAARTRVYRGDQEVEVGRTHYQMEDYVHQVLDFEVEQGRSTRIEKMVALFTTRDRAVNEPQLNAEEAVLRYQDFAPALERHRRAWDELWTACDMLFPADPEIQFLLRFHIGHILQTCSPHTADLDAGVPARGLNGEAYRGHVFWDELYIYPFLNYRLPQITQGLLMYRYRRLGQARALAREAGYRGAMYPWQSGSDGREETQVVHLNPASGRWDPDLSHRQRHVNAAIFYNVWNYYEATGDIEFLLARGAEMMLEIARFWASIVHLNPERGRYEIHGVMGPDEFHEKYPNSQEEGLHNNAYTNVMVAWIFDTAQRVLALLPEQRRRALCASIGLTDEEIRLWEDISHKMFVPFQDEGIISQFEGWESLDELDWEAYRAKHRSIQRLDRILKAEGDSPDRYKLAKQADALMLFYLFSEGEVRAILERLGYRIPDDFMRRNVEHYEARTSHGSTLSFIVHAHVLTEVDPERSWRFFREALESDIGDVQGGTTKEGIHMGVMAGTLDLVQRAYAGAVVRDGVLRWEPHLLEKLEGLSSVTRFQGVQLRARLEGGQLEVVAQRQPMARPVRVGVDDDVQELQPGERHVFSVLAPAARPAGGRGRPPAG
ncbi:MAG: glycoside hydrolase family 65 protein [Candidatus Dormibacteraeota bacterium]|nr:glycoside hydrolase family 65 protein [Candidatus Dormibacteraeota bacterium]